MEQRFRTPRQKSPDLSSPPLTVLSTAGKPRVITTLAAYVPAPYDGKNHSGIEPLGDRVLVLPDVAEDQTQGGVYIPQDVSARNAMGAETGVLVAVGEGAFVWTNDRIHPWAGRKPQPGDRVVIERYSGQVQRGLDGLVYRVCDAKAIGALLVVSAETAIAEGTK